MAAIDFVNKDVLIVGLAKTGLAVARFLKDKDCRVTISDQKSEVELGSYASLALATGARLKLGPQEEAAFCDYDLIIVSPGISENIAPLEAARQRAIPIIGEMELASQYINCPIVAISGTNGKTTTTELVGEMLKLSGRKVFVGGNIGTPLIEYVCSGEQTGLADIIVAEVSSFQLDTAFSFTPKVAVLLNVTEDHLDRYPDMDAYAASKARLFMNQGPEDIAILNRIDPYTKRIAANICATKYYFNKGRSGQCGTDEPLASQNIDYGARHDLDNIVCSLPDGRKEIVSLANFKLMGKHNVENAAAASLAAFAAGACLGSVQQAIDSFCGLPHRCEYVATIKGVRYYNDSKGTNVNAVERCLEGFDSPVVLIMGGRDKGGSYQSLSSLIRQRVKKLIVIGEASEKIIEALHMETTCNRAETLETAVDMAHQAACAGDTVLLSPGCSSFDMFSSYAQRGQVFCKAVDFLKAQHASGTDNQS